MSETTPPKRGPRFSLLGLLLLMTIAAMGVGLWRLYSELAPLRQEVEQYRNVLGIIRVEEPTKIHALRLPTASDEPRKYRVYLPAGRSYFWHYSQSAIPKDAIPTSKGSGRLAPGEYIFSVQFKRDIDELTREPQPRGTFRIEIEAQGGQADGGSIFVGVSEQKQDWIVNRETGGMAYGWQEPGRTVELSDPEAPYVLYRARAHEIVVNRRNAEGKPSSWGFKHFDDPCEGFMLWISGQRAHERE